MHWSLGEKAAISTMDVALAYHCQNQDMILKRVLKPYGENSWEDIKQYRDSSMDQRCKKTTRIN